MVANLRRLQHVLSASNPLPPPSPNGIQPPVPPAGQAAGPVSADGRTAYITVRFDTPPLRLGTGYLPGVDQAVAPLRAAGVEVEYGGPLGELARPQPDGRVSELIGYGAAVVVLLPGFGSVLAAGVPLLASLPSDDGYMSANIVPGKSVSRCSARNANTLPAGINSRHVTYASGPTGHVGGRSVIPTTLAPHYKIGGREQPNVFTGFPGGRAPGRRPAGCPPRGTGGTTASVACVNLRHQRPALGPEGARQSGIALAGTSQIR
ncbi:hypothetical protein [Streptomyces triculaminicus]|uniref:hypothetical protein n=1 Tax=Streptomyces triculaminicus TaxID=2816232 RepID=UPI003F4D583D